MSSIALFVLFLISYFILEKKNTIYRGENNKVALPIGSRLDSENGHVCLSMQKDGNLVIYARPDTPGQRPIWSSKTDGLLIKDGLVFQGDGNLCLYDSEGKCVWATMTNATEVDRFTLQNDGDFVGFGRHGSKLWKSNSSVSTIWRSLSAPSETLLLGTDLVSENGKVRLCMQENGNLVILCEGSEEPIWTSKTEGQKINGGLFFQYTDGNLVLYNTDKVPVWATMTQWTEVNQFIIQNDGNFVGKGKYGTVYWESGSKCPC